jgi:integrase
MWPPAQPGATQYVLPRGRGIQTIPEDTPLACWLPVKLGLTPHGLRHSHKTWMETGRVASDASWDGIRRIA